MWLIYLFIIHLAYGIDQTVLAKLFSVEDFWTDSMNKLLKLQLPISWLK